MLGALKRLILAESGRSSRHSRLPVKNSALAATGRYRPKADLAFFATNARTYSRMKTALATTSTVQVNLPICVRLSEQGH